jgi:hypothetical protein
MRHERSLLKTSTRAKQPFRDRSTSSVNGADAAVERMTGILRGMPSPTRSSSRRAAPRPWIYLFAAPIIWVMATALVDDQREIGEPAADVPLPALIAILFGMTTLMAAVWAFSRFRYRTVVGLFQVAVVWVGGLLFAVGIRTHVTFWDVTEDAVLLVTTLLQLLPGDRSVDEGTEEPAGATEPATDPILGRWRRLRKPLGAVLLVWLIVRNREELMSGSPLPTAAALALICFFGWLFLRSGPSFDAETVTAEGLRATNRREMGWWSLWTGLAAAFIGWASAVNGFQPRSLIVVAIPLSLLVLSALGYQKADTIAAKAQESRNR